MTQTANMKITPSSFGNLLLNFVSAPPNGFDILRFFKGVSHFLSQMPDMNGNGVIAFAVILILPYLMKQFFRADHAARLPAENLQD